MDRTRTDLLKLLPGRPRSSCQDLSLTGFTASRGFPVEFTCRARTGSSSWRSSLEIIDQAEGDRPRRGRQHRLSGRHAGDPGHPRSRQGRRTRRQRHRRSAAKSSTLIGGQIFTANTAVSQGRPSLLYPRPLRAGSNTTTPRTSTTSFLRNNRGSDGELVPLHAVTDHQGRTAPAAHLALQPRARDPDLRQRRPRQVASRTRSTPSRRSARSPAAGLPRARSTGSGNAFREAFDGLIFALILGIAVAYMVLASQFNSFIHPITVLMALAVQPFGRAARALWSPPVAEPVQHDRPYSADGDREEELDSARRLHQPAAGGGARSHARRCSKPARSACARSS